MMPDEIKRRAADFARLAAAAFFEGRKGHGGGPCSRINLRPEELEAVLSIAFETGAETVVAKAKVEGRRP